jgi:hypothetical protein
MDFPMENKPNHRLGKAQMIEMVIQWLSNGYPMVRNG